MKKTNPTEKWIRRMAREISVGASGDEVSAVRMLKGRGGTKLDENDFGGDPSTLRRARKEIEEYIEGKRKGFDLRVDLSRLSLFARDVLRAAEKIPYGETRSYSWVARESGHPQAARAVGGALHRNPVPLFMP